MPNVVITQDKTDVPIFLDEMFRSQFCLVPQGHAPWTFRFSEAIYAGMYNKWGIKGRGALRDTSILKDLQFEL